MLAIIVRNRRQILIKESENVIDHSKLNGAAIITNLIIENVNYSPTDTAETAIYEVPVSSYNISWSDTKPEVSFMAKRQLPDLYLEPLQALTNIDVIYSHYFGVSIADGDQADDEDRSGFPAYV